MTAYFLNLFRHHMCLICGSPAIWMRCPGDCKRPVQFSNLEGGLACELRQAYCATQKRSGLDSSACSRKRLPIAVPLVFSQSFFFLLDYELIRLLKAITTVFEYLGQINQAEQSHRKTTSLCPLSSWGNILVIIIGSRVFFSPLAGMSNNVLQLRLTLTCLATCV